MTDFPKAVASVSMGLCPVCDEELTPTGVCERDELSWRVDEVDGRSVLWHSRNLTPEEIKRLHDRGNA